MSRAQDDPTVDEAVVVLVVIGVGAILGLVLAQTGQAGGLAGLAGATEVPIEQVQENPERYLGQRITLVGWYQGGLIRDADPICANTREGVQRRPYAFVYTQVPEGTTIYTGQKYRFTGVVREGDAIERPIPGAQPVVVLESIEPLENASDDCRLFDENASTG